MTDKKDNHADLKRAAEYALAAYMHHCIYDKTGRAPHHKILEICAGHCIAYAMGIVEKTIKLVNGGT